MNWLQKVSQVDNVGNMIDQVINDSSLLPTIIPKLQQLIESGEPVCDQLESYKQKNIMIVDQIQRQIGCNNVMPPIQQKEQIMPIESESGQIDQHENIVV